MAGRDYGSGQRSIPINGSNNFAASGRGLTYCLPVLWSMKPWCLQFPQVQTTVQPGAHCRLQLGEPVCQKRYEQP